MPSGDHNDCNELYCSDRDDQDDDDWDEGAGVIAWAIVCLFIVLGFCIVLALWGDT